MFFALYQIFQRPTLCWSLVLMTLCISVCTGAPSTAPSTPKVTGSWLYSTDDDYLAITFEKDKVEGNIAIVTGLIKKQGDLRIDRVKYQWSKGNRLSFSKPVVKFGKGPVTVKVKGSTMTLTGNNGKTYTLKKEAD